MMTWKRLVFPAAILLFGLAVSQAVFTALVYISNHMLHAELAGMKAAGYLVIPNELVMPDLLRFMPAFSGALFFTLTTGACLTLAAFFAAWAQKILFSASRIFKAVTAAGWLALLIGGNLQGFNLAATLVFLLIPPAVFAAAIAWMPRARGGNHWLRAAHIAVVAAAAAAWIPCLQQDTFMSIRDYLLLSNSAGKQVNEFYYTYTLYPANLIRPMDNKLIKPCRIENAGTSDRYRQIARRLVEYDYLPVSENAPAGLTIRAENDRLCFAAGSSVLLETGLHHFLSGPGQTLKTVSGRADKNRFLRQATLIGLIAGFPLGLYVLVHAAFCLLLGFIRPVSMRGVCASLLCLLLAAAVMIPLYAEGFQKSRPSQINAALESESWYRQRNALKAIVGQNHSFKAWDIATKLARSPHVPVRYWLARALGSSQSAKVRGLLKTLTTDTSPNVSCMAYSSLGRAGDKETVNFIKSRISEIQHWYVQKYAYNAMRRLGWKQRVSNTRGSLLP